MKTYQFIRVRTSELPKVALEEAKEGWHVLAVLPARFSPVTETSGLELIDIVITFERDNP